MANKYYRGFQKLFKFGKSAGEDTGKSINTIVGIPPAKNLKKRFDSKQDIFKSVDKIAGPIVSNQAKSKIKNEASKKISKIYDKYEKATKKIVEKKAGGGRIGRKFGSPKPKTNVEKIKETFSSKKNVPSKLKGFSKLPEAVQQKMNKKLARKV